MIDDRTPSPAVTLGPYTVEYLGRRMGRRVLRICAGRHALDVFATLDGRAARVSAELDGKKLTRRRKQRLWRRWSDDLIVKRWVLAAAAEFDGAVPRWSCRAIAQNLKRARRGEMTGEAVRRLIWRLSPALAERRAHYWKTHKKKNENPQSPKARAAERQAVIGELKRAGLL